MIREHLPEEEQVNIFADLAARKVRFGGYATVSEYLNRIQATPVERSACLLKAGGGMIQYLARKKKITQADLESLSAWATI